MPPSGLTDGACVVADQGRRRRGSIEPAAIASCEAGSRLQLTIDVDDVDAMCAELAEAGRMGNRSEP